MEGSLWCLEECFMSNWIYHEMWFRDPEKENLFQKLKDDRFIQDVTYSDGGTGHELNVGKMSP